MAESIKERERNKKAELAQIREQMERDKDDPQLKARFADIIAELLCLSFLSSKVGENEPIGNEAVNVQRDSLNNEGQLDAFIRNNDEKKLGEMFNNDTLAENFAGYLKRSAEKDDKQWYKNGRVMNAPDNAKNNKIFIHDISDSVDRLEREGVSSRLLKNAKKAEKWSRLAASGNKAAIAGKLKALFEARHSAAEYLHGYAPKNGDEKDLWLNSSKKKVAAAKDLIRRLDNELVRMGAISKDYSPQYNFGGKGFHYEDKAGRPDGADEYHPLIVISNEEKRANRKFARSLDETRKKMSAGGYGHVGSFRSAEYKKMVRSTDRMLTALSEVSSGSPGKTPGEIWANKVSALMKARKDAVKYLAKKRLDAGIDPGNREAWRKYRPSGRDAGRRYNSAVSMVQSIDEELARMGVCKHGTKLDYRVKDKNGRVVSLRTTVFARGNYDKMQSSVESADMAAANKIISGAAEKKKKAEEASSKKNEKDLRIREIQDELNEKTNGGMIRLDEDTMVEYAAKLIAAEAIRAGREQNPDRPQSKSEALREEDDFEQRWQKLKDNETLRNVVDEYINGVKKPAKDGEQPERIGGIGARRLVGEILLGDRDNIAELREVFNSAGAAAENRKRIDDTKKDHEKKAAENGERTDKDNYPDPAGEQKAQEQAAREREQTETEKFMSEPRIKQIQAELTEKNRGGEGKLSPDELLEYTAKILAANEIRLEREARKASGEPELAKYKEANRYDDLWNEKTKDPALREFVGLTIDRLTERGMLNEKLLGNAAADLPKEFNKAWVVNRQKENEWLKENHQELVNDARYALRSFDKDKAVDTIRNHIANKNLKTVKVAITAAAYMVAAEKIRKEHHEKLDKGTYKELCEKEAEKLKNDDAFKDFVKRDIFKAKEKSVEDKVRSFIGMMTDEKSGSMLEGFEKYKVEQKKREELSRQKKAGSAQQAPDSVWEAADIERLENEQTANAQAQGAQAQGARAQGAKVQKGADGKAPDIGGNRIKVIDEINKAAQKDALPTSSDVEIMFTRLLIADKCDVAPKGDELYGKKIEDVPQEDIHATKEDGRVQGFFRTQKQACAEQKIDYSKFMMDKMLKEGGRSIVAEYENYNDRLENNKAQWKQQAEQYNKFHLSAAANNKPEMQPMSAG